MGKALGLRGSEVVVGWIERNTELCEEEERCFAAGVLQVSVQWELSIVFSFSVLKHGMVLDHKRSKPFGVTLQCVLACVSMYVRTVCTGTSASSVQ